MLDTPVDAWYLWIGLSVAALGFFGLAAGLPVAPPPDADAAASTIDRVAAATHDATASVPLDATEVSLSNHSIELTGPGGTDRERFAFGPVTPVEAGTRLARVLKGIPPSRLFTSTDAFAHAVAAAQNDQTSFVDPGQLRVRTILWGDVHVTLVG